MELVSRIAIFDIYVLGVDPVVIGEWGRRAENYFIDTYSLTGGGRRLSFVCGERFFSREHCRKNFRDGGEDFRHPFATHFLEENYYIQTDREPLGIATHT